MGMLAAVVLVYRGNSDYINNNIYRNYKPNNIKTLKPHQQSDLTTS